MATQIGIISNALMLIGDEPISSLEEPGAGAQAASGLYRDTYHQLLSTYPWSFATILLESSRIITDIPELVEWQYAHQLPGDLIRLWSVRPYGDYQIVGKRLLTNHEQLLLEYICPVLEDTLPPQFVKALEYRIAADMAMLVTESQNKAQYYDQKADIFLNMAKTIDSQNRPQIPIVDRPYTNVRFGGYNNQIGR